MRLAVGRSAGYCRPDTGSQIGVDEINVETDVEHAITGFHLFDHAADQHPDAELIDLTHISKTDAALAQQILFHPVDRTHSEKFKPIRSDRRSRLLAQQAVEPWLAAKEARRHAMHVARKRGHRGVIVRMSVEPEHKQFASCFAPVSSYTVHRAHRKGMVTAKEYRRRAGARQLIGARAQCANPALDFTVVPGVVGGQV